MSGLSLVLLPSTVFDLVYNGLPTRKSLFGSRHTSFLSKDMSSRSRAASKTRESDVSSGHKRADPLPDREPPPAPPIIILSQNSRTGGSQPHKERDPAHPPHQPTSSQLSKHFLPEDTRCEAITATAPKKPSPEPHPAPPVIILATHKRPASASPPRSPSPPTLTPRTTTNTPRPLHTSTMGSKASKIKPTNGKLQSSQEKKDKDEMKEPPNYYTHRSKSMRRKAGKEGTTDGAGGAVGGTAGAGGVM